MKNNIKKILIFVGLVVLQIGLAYVLVTYILPPGRINNFANTSNIVNSETLDPADSTSINNEVTESTKDNKGDKIDTTASKAVNDSTSVDESVMVEGMSDYIEEQLTDKELVGAYTFTIDEIIANPAQTRGTRYVVMSLSVIAKGKNLETRLEAKRPAINDAINTLISRKSVLWLSDIDNRPFLREEIRILLETIIGDVKVLRIYFTKYIFQ
jgi:flagellar basal body-associated protein FliL